MSLGLGLALPYRQGGQFNPATLFANNEQGGWYDPADLSTLFQDAGGTTPVTALGQPVGLALDKRSGLVPGPELRANGVIGLVGVATAAAYNTSTGAGSVTRVDAANQSFVQFSGLAAGALYRLTIQGTGGGGQNINVRSGDQGAATAFTAIAGQTTTGYAAASAGGLITITASGAFTTTFTLQSITLIPGNHLTQSTATSRPLWQQDGTTGAFFLQFDGFDDFLTIGTFNMSASDKVTVCAGLRKISATTAVAVELSAQSTTDNGAFGIFAPDSAAQYTFASRGTLLAAASTVDAQFAAPHTGVVTGTGDIAADGCRLAIGGIQRGITGSDQGTGNYGAAYPLFVGRRGGTTLPLNGRLHGLVIRGGAITDAQRAALERFMANRTGIPL